jgi:hypothetical protein
MHAVHSHPLHFILKKLMSITFCLIYYPFLSWSVQSVSCTFCIHAGVISETVDNGRNISVLEPECESLPVFPTRYSISSSWLYKYWTSCIAWTKEQEHTQTIVPYSFGPATALNNQNTRITYSQGGDIPQQIRPVQIRWFRLEFLYRIKCWWYNCVNHSQAK